MRTVSTVIIKPTKHCNADCTYCSAPPEVNGAPKWSLDQFRKAFDSLAPHLTPRAFLIWHGGEPMLMGPDFYWKAWEHARSSMPEINFSIQTNLLAYSSDRWRDVFRDVFNGGISSSYDPDESQRTYKGDASLYSALFFSRLRRVLGDGFRPKVIGTYGEETAHMADQAYDLSRSFGEQGFDLRFNYRYPAGRDAGRGPSILPETYGRMILRIYERWITDLPVFTVTPQDEMLKRVVGLEAGRCPWTRSCGGRFLGVEPNGDVYNCSEFADLDDPEYRFGNLFQDRMEGILASKAAVAIRRRRVDLPADCMTCRHFQECEGGCARDSVLYGRGLGGKFFYCKSWMMMFDRIKESVASGEADGAIAKYGLDPLRVRRASAPRAAA